jgi:hypothetical protein
MTAGRSARVRARRRRGLEGEVMLQSFIGFDSC